MLAAAAFPGMAQANSGVTPVVNTQDWTGGEYDATNSVYVSNSGEKISIPLGEKAQGSYTVNIANIDASRTALKVTVAGVTKDVAQNETSVSIDFSIDKATKITVVVEAVTPQKFSVGVGDGTTVVLNYDFSKPYGLLNAILTSATNKIATYNKATFDNQVWNRESANIRSILDTDIQNDAPGSYQAYVDYELYKITNSVPDDNKLVQRIKTAEDNASAAYGAALVKDIKASDAYTALQTAWTNTNDTVRGKLQSDYDKIDSSIATFESNYKAQGSDFDYNGEIEKIETAITNLTTKIGETATAVKNNQDAYDQVNADIASASGTSLTDLAKVLQGDRYAHLLAAGNKKMAAEIEKLKDVKAKNDASYKNESAYTDKSARNAEINGITSNLSNILSEYGTELKDILDPLEDSYDGVKNTLAEDTTEYTAATVNKYATERDALTDAIAAVRTVIDGAQTGANADCQALRTLNIDDLILAVNTAQSNLTTKCSAEKARLADVAKAQQILSEIDEKWQAAKDSVATLKYGDDVVDKYDWGTGSDTDEGGIGKDIIDYKTRVNNDIKNEVAAGHGSFATIDTKKNEIETRIANYVTNFSEAAANYNTVKDSVDATSKLLEAAYNNIKEKDAYKAENKDYTSTNYDYEAGYSAALATITAANQKIADSKDKTKQLGKTDNTDAAKALSFDAATVNSFLEQVSNHFKEDSTALQAHLDELALEQQKEAVKDAYDKLVADIDEVQGKIDDTTNPLGKGKDDIKTKLDAVKQIITDNNLDDRVNAFATATDGKDFAAINTLTSSLNDSISNIKDLVKDAEAAVAENKTAHTNQVNALNALNASFGDNGQKIKDAAGKSYTANDGTNSNNEKGRIDNIVSDIQGKLNDLGTAIETAFNAQLSKDSTENFNKDVDALKELINVAINDSAANMKTNYDNYLKLVKLDGGELKLYYGNDIVNDVIAAAANDAKVVDSEAGQTYYADDLIGIQFQKKADDYVDEIKEQYKNNGFKGKDNTLNYGGSNGSIKQLIDLIKGIKSGNIVKTNHDAYYDADPIKGLKAHEQAVEEVWTNKSNELAAGDQSSKLAARQATLNSYYTQLVNREKADKEGYDKGLFGEYDVNGAKNTSPKNIDTYHQKLTEIQADIEKLVNDALNVDSVANDISADNETTWKAINDAKNAAQKAYSDAVNFVDAYKNLKSQTLTASDQTVLDQYAIINDQTTGVYTYANTINTKFKDAETEHSNTKAPKIFDRNGDYVKAFNQYTEEINTKYNNFLSAIKNSLTGVGEQLKTDSTKIANAITTANATYNWTSGSRTDWTSIFESLKSKVTTAQGILKKDSISAGDYRELDNILVDIESNFNAELDAAIDAAAKADVDGKITAAEENYKKAEREIDDGTLEAFQTEDKVKVTTARDLYDAGGLNKQDNAAYDQIKLLITGYNQSNGYKTFLANNAAYTKATGNLSARETQLKNALESIKDYACVEEIKKQAETISTQINSLKEQADADNTASPRDAAALNAIAETAKANGTIDQSIKSLISQSGNLFDTEKEYLDARMKELTAAYNLYAATATPEDVATHKANIDAIQTAIDAAAAVTPANKKKASDLQALESKIEAEFNTVAEKATADAQSELKTSLKAVSDKAVWGDVDDEVKEDASLSADLQSLQDDIKAVESEISNASLLDKNRIEDEITALNSRADELAGKISEKDAEVKAKKEAIANANTAIDKYFQDLLGLVDNSKAELNNTFTDSDSKADKFTNKYDQVTTRINNAKNAINTSEGTDNRDLVTVAEDGTVTVNENQLTVKQSDVLNDLLQIKNLAAYRQLKKDLGNYEEIETIKSTLNKELFTDADYKKLVGTDVDGGLYGEVVAAYNAADGAISTNWNNGVSYAASSNVTLENSNYTASENLIKAFNAKVDEFKKFYDENVTKPDLNRDGKADGDDVQLVIDAAQKGTTVEGNERLHVSKSDSSVIDIYDIQAIINAINE